MSYSTRPCRRATNRCARASKGVEGMPHARHAAEPASRIVSPATGTKPCGGNATFSRAESTCRSNRATPPLGLGGPHESAPRHRLGWLAGKTSAATDSVYRAAAPCFTRQRPRPSPSASSRRGRGRREAARADAGSMAAASSNVAYSLRGPSSGSRSHRVTLPKWSTGPVPARASRSHGRDTCWNQRPHSE